MTHGALLVKQLLAIKVGRLRAQADQGRNANQHHAPHALTSLR
jgi:hypothetical protein